ncbi:hypothetical protein ES703_88193 [subsurface metagenome]
MFGVLCGMLLGAVGQVVDAGSGVALFAFSYQVSEFVGVAGGLPDHRVHKDTAIEADHIIPHLDDAFPPRFFDVVF